MPEPISVVVATRDRGDAVTGALRSILACRPAPREVWVLDQSRDHHTADAMAGFLDDPRVRYLRSPSSGLSRAHNLAIARSDAALIAVTDDDCVVPPDWLDRLERAFTTDPRVGIVFGNVVAAAHDTTQGFVPAYARETPFLAREPHDKWRIEGMGACMAIRRKAWEDVGGFDEALGSGGRYPAAGEGDFALRVLRAGWFVYETPAAAVVHHGFRSASEGRALLAEYARGTGAMMAKHIRCGTPGARGLLGRMAWRWIRRRRPDAVGLGAEYSPLARLGGFARGFLSGTRAPLDRERWLFRNLDIRKEGE